MGMEAGSSGGRENEPSPARKGDRDFWPGGAGVDGACGGCCAAKSASWEFTVAPPNGSDFFPLLGLFPKPNRAPRERIEERLDPPLPLLPYESPEWAVDAVLGESDFFLPTGPAAGESKGWEDRPRAEAEFEKPKREVGDRGCGCGMAGTEREVEIEVGWGLSMDLREKDFRPVKDIVDYRCTGGGPEQLGLARVKDS